MLESMLMGTFRQTMDAKGRMNFPTKLREVLGEQFIVTQSLTKEPDGCLYVYSLADYELKAEKIRKLPMTREGQWLQRRFLSGARLVEADKQGRILLPLELRTYAGLSTDVVVAGVADRAEIWDESKWEKLNSEIDDEKLMEALSGLDL
ncbi:MAG: division/cell wall cluster transcriptional repressor MraZ [Oscillospiraceae bacterium]